MHTNYFNIENIYEDLQKQNCILSVTCNSYKEDLKLKCSFNTLKELFSESLDDAEKINIFTKHNDINVRRLVMNTYDGRDLDYIQFNYGQRYYNFSIEEIDKILKLL